MEGRGNALDRCLDRCGVCSKCLASASDFMRKLSVSDAFLSQRMYSSDSKPSSYKNIFSIDPSVIYRNKEMAKEFQEITSHRGGESFPPEEEEGITARYSLSVGPRASRQSQAKEPLDKLHMGIFHAGVGTQAKKPPEKPKQSSEFIRLSPGSPSLSPKLSITLSPDTSAKDPGTPYNPIRNAKYDSSGFPRIKTLTVPICPVINLFKTSATDIASLIKLNQIYGLPKITAQYINLTRDILALVLEQGGLCAVDKKNLWPMLSRKINYQTGNFSRLRMYYIMACYFYEQIAMHHQKQPPSAPDPGEPPAVFLIVYSDSNKSDDLDLILSTLIASKRKISVDAAQDAPAGERPTPRETSTMIEIVYFVNKLYSSKGAELKARSIEDLLVILSKIRNLRCISESTRSLLGCREIDALKHQFHLIVMKHLSRLLASLHGSASMEIRFALFATKELILKYEAYLKEELSIPSEKCTSCGARRSSDLPSLITQSLAFISKASIFHASETSLELAQLALADEGQSLVSLLLFYWNVLKDSPLSRGNGIFLKALHSDGFRDFVERMAASMLSKLIFEEARGPGLYGQEEAPDESKASELSIKLVTCNLAVFKVFCELGFGGNKLLFLWKLLLARALAPSKPSPASTAPASFERLSKFIVIHWDALDLKSSVGMFTCQWLEEVLAHPSLPSVVLRVCDLILRQG